MSLELLGKELASLYDDVDFIGIQEGIDRNVCMFNCNRTGATFCGNDPFTLGKRLEEIRTTFKHIKNKA
jgi:hypothetical protein